jgi:hypothetical protein
MRQPLMYSLTYISSANRLYSDEELKGLADLSTRNNLRYDITGVLLYKGGSFMQLLEGTEESVRTLYSIIGCDTRHRGLIRLLQGSIDERRYPGWPMRTELIPEGGARSFDIGDFDQAIIGKHQPALTMDPARSLLLNFARCR